MDHFPFMGRNLTSLLKTFQGLPFSPKIKNEILMIYEALHVLVLVNLSPLLSCALATWTFLMLSKNVILPILKPSHRLKAPYSQISPIWLTTSHNFFGKNVSQPPD